MPDYPHANRQPEAPVALKFIALVLTAATVLLASVVVWTHIGTFAVERALDATTGRVVWDANGTPVRPR